MSTYQDWLANQKALAEKAYEIIRKANPKSALIDDPNKPSFVRIYFADRHIDIKVKQIKSRHVRHVWLCRCSEVSRTTMWIIYTEREKGWYICTNQQILLHAEKRPSDYRKVKEDYYVISPEFFREAKSFLKLMKKRYEEQLQKRMEEWF